MFAETEAWVVPHHMGKYLLIQEIGQPGNIELGRFDQDLIFVGRDPGEPGLRLEHSAVSRRHGVFRRCGAVWMYKDLGSTNGSWVNGQRVNPDRLYVIRSGDVVQVADVGLNLTEGIDGPEIVTKMGENGSIGGRSLLAFCKDQFVGEFVVPEYGRALVVGGSAPDLELEGDLFEMPSLVVERRGDSICAYSVAREMPLFLNGHEFSEIVVLKDQDEIRIANYVIVFNDPGRRKYSPIGGGIVASGSWGQDRSGAQAWSGKEVGTATQAKSSLSKNYSPAAKVVRKSVFGQQPSKDFEDETLPMDTGGVTSIGHPALRSIALYRKDQPQSENSLASLEDKIILGVGCVMLLGLMGLLLWWALG